MKIAIPVDVKDIESSVCESFGRAPYFLIYDTETKEETTIDNGAAEHRRRGDQSAQIIPDQE